MGGIILTLDSTGFLFVRVALVRDTYCLSQYEMIWPVNPLVKIKKSIYADICQSLYLLVLFYQYP